MSIEKLEQLKENLISLGDKLDEVLKQKRELEKEPIIQEYKQLQNESENLNIVYDRLNSEYKRTYIENCPHSLWYFIQDATDPYEGRTTWECKCLRCGLNKEIRPASLNNNLIIESGNMGFGKRCYEDYYTVSSDYKNLEKENNDEDTIRKILIKKYNNRDNYSK